MFDYFLAVDCGLRGCGCAVFGDSGGDHARIELLRAFYVKNSCKKERGALAWATMAQEVLLWAGREMPVVIETMRFRVGAKSEILRIKDILEVQGVAGAVAALCSDDPGCVVGYLPDEWKGSVDGDVMTQRILNRLTPEELQECPKWLTGANHNTVDAIGIGLHHLGRLKAGRVVAR